MCDWDCTIDSKVGLEKSIAPAAFQRLWRSERANNYPVFRVSGWSKQNITSLLTPGEMSSAIRSHAGWAACLLLRFPLPKNTSSGWRQVCFPEKPVSQGGTNLSDECTPRRVYSHVVHTHEEPGLHLQVFTASLHRPDQEIINCTNLLISVSISMSQLK